MSPPDVDCILAKEDSKQLTSSRVCGYFNYFSRLYHFYQTIPGKIKKILIEIIANTALMWPTRL
jgi:hypothetical protein